MMESYDEILYSSLFGIGDKRPITDNDYGVYPEPKRLCTLPFGGNHDHGTTMAPTYPPSSWVSLNGAVVGSMIALGEPHLDPRLPQCIGAQTAVEFPLWPGCTQYFTESSFPFGPDWPELAPEHSKTLWPGWPEFSPGYSTLLPQGEGILDPSSEAETYCPGIETASVSFTDESLFYTFPQVDLEINLQHPQPDPSQRQLPSVLEESKVAFLGKDVAHSALKSSSIWDECNNMPPQFAGDSLLKWDETRTLPSIQEHTTPSSGTVALEPVSTVSQEPKTSPGQSTVAFRRSRPIKQKAR
jgi:hypothetical protein